MICQKCLFLKIETDPTQKEYFREGIDEEVYGSATTNDRVFHHSSIIYLCARAFVQLLLHILLESYLN